MNLDKSSFKQQISYLKQDIVRALSFYKDKKAKLLFFFDAGFLIVVFYRVFRGYRFTLIHIPLLRALLEKIVELLLKSHFPSSLVCGPGLVIFHGFGIVVNAKSKLGNNVTLYHGVTIGERFPGDECPIISNRVSVGCNASVFGPIRIPAGKIVKSGDTIVYSRKIKN